MSEGEEWKVCKGEHSVGRYDPHEVQCDEATTARFVRLSVVSTGKGCVPLYLHEVKVVGTPVGMYTFLVVYCGIRNFNSSAGLEFVQFPFGFS